MQSEDSLVQLLRDLIQKKLNSTSGYSNLFPNLIQEPDYDKEIDRILKVLEHSKNEDTEKLRKEVAALTNRVQQNEKDILQLKILLKGKVKSNEIVSPAKGDVLEKWFDYMYALKQEGKKYTLDQLANDSGYSRQHIGKQHVQYKKMRKELKGNK